jgi:hypothetical protein
VLNYEKFSVNCHFFSHQCRDTGWEVTELW